MPRDLRAVGIPPEGAAAPEEVADDRAGPPLGLPEVRKGAPDREGARIAGVDPGDHRSGSVRGGVLSEAADEEIVDALVLAGGVAPRDAEVAEKAELSTRRERPREEPFRPGDDGARLSPPDDPARRRGVGEDEVVLKAEVRDQAFGGLRRPKRVRPGFEDESLLADRPDGAPETPLGLEEDGLARRAPPVGGDESGETAADDDDLPRHASGRSLAETVDASDRMNSGWSFSPSVTT